MKKIVAFFFLICLTSTVIFAQKQKNIPNDSIIFENFIHDYGTVNLGSPGQYEFRFTNGMKTPLVVNNVRPSCGCTVADWTKEPVLPGKSGVIKINYNTNLLGTFNKSITVNSNAKNAIVILRVKGNVINPKK